jgi:hypothetical protein
MTRVWPLHGIFLHLDANGLLSNLRKCPIWSKRTLRIGLTSVRVLEFDGVGVVGELAGFDDRCDNGRPCFFPCIMLALIRPSATSPKTQEIQYISFWNIQRCSFGFVL